LILPRMPIMNSFMGNRTYRMPRSLIIE
jgi:hypothetical protein